MLVITTVPFLLEQDKYLQFLFLCRFLEDVKK